MKTQPYYVVRTSRIHGRGVFANKAIRKGTKVIEYTGPIVSREEADEIGAQTENGHSHTMLFQIDKERVINGNEGGDALVGDESTGPGSKSLSSGDAVDIALKALLASWATTPTLGTLNAFNGGLGFNSSGADGSVDTLWGGTEADAFFGLAIDLAPDRGATGYGPDLN